MAQLCIRTAFRYGCHTFYFNGVIYLRSELVENINVDNSGKWYNLILGVCLLGVVIFPHKQFQVLHYAFAIAFFVGNAVVTGVFHTKTWPRSNRALSILTVAGLAFYFANEYWLHIFIGYTLLWAEWISIAVVAVHFFLDSLDN